MIERGSVVYTEVGVPARNQYFYYLVLGALYDETWFKDDFNACSIEPEASEESKLYTCLNKMCEIYVLPIGMYSKNTDKDVLLYMLKYTLQNSVLIRPLDSLTHVNFRSIHEMGFGISEKDLDVFLLKSKMSGILIDFNIGTLTDLNIENIISIKDYIEKLKPLLQKRFSFDISNTKKTLQYKTRYMYIYKTEKVFRLYYCAAKTKDGKYMFCCAYNKNLKDGSPDMNEINKVISNMQCAHFLNSVKIKPRIIENKELLEIEGVQAPKQFVDYYFYYNAFSNSICKKSRDEDLS